MNNIFKQFNIRDKKYAIPLIFLPFIIFFTILFTSPDEVSELDKSSTISVNLGKGVDSEIGDKLESYEKNNDLRGGDDITLSGLNEEKVKKDSLYGVSQDQKMLDSMAASLDELTQRAELQRQLVQNDQARRGSGYVPTSQGQRDAIAESKRNEQELADLLNQQDQKYGNDDGEDDREDEGSGDDAGLRAMKQQIMLMDSLDRATNPERLKNDRNAKRAQLLDEEKDFFMNSSLSVSKADNSKYFNTTFKSKKSEFIKAVIDEDIKGYLGSRIRLRLLEDIYVGRTLLPKGAFLYSTIHGFSPQRVNLKIVSALINDEILPINLEIYDVDGMQGLYVPSSFFRELSEAVASSSLQGQNIAAGGGEDFYQSMISKAFTSTSAAISSLIRKHKAKVKYNSHLYLIDEKQLQDKRKEIYEKNK